MAVVIVVVQLNVSAES